MRSPCNEIEHRLSGLFLCEQVGDVVRIQTPYLYPDGDLIDIFYSEAGGVPTFSDMGETLRWLRTQTSAAKRTQRQTRMIQDISVSQGVELHSGVLSVRSDAGRFAEDITLLAQTCLRVSDVWFTFKTRAIASMIEDVAEFLDDKQISYEKGVALVGRSARSWNVDFQTRTPLTSSLVQVLTTGSRGSVHRLTEHATAQWMDLANYRVGHEPRRFVTLFDDTIDIWLPEDFKLVSEVSDVAFWSQPEEFLHSIAA
jgi:hypothetical protein